MYEREIIGELRELDADNQREVLDFATFLRQQRKSKRPKRSMMGTLEHLNIHVTEDDIREMRQESWKNFPRDLQG